MSRNSYHRGEDAFAMSQRRAYLVARYLYALDRFTRTSRVQRLSQTGGVLFP